LATQPENEDGPEPNEPWSINALPRRLALTIIRFYQRAISPLTPPSCRFHPTCSHYTYDAIERFGLVRGSLLGAIRLCKCNPFHRGGYDPVPEALSPGKQKRLDEGDNGAPGEY
jgi:putative membrane protein insertion efficiency factor